MSYEEIENMLKSTGLPVAYWQFDEPPTVPYIVFTLPKGTAFYADGKPYVDIENLQVELYVAKKSPELEKLLQEKFAEYGLGYERTEYYIESEKLYQELYTMEV